MNDIEADGTKIKRAWDCLYIQHGTELLLALTFMGLVQSGLVARKDPAVVQNNWLSLRRQRVSGQIRGDHVGFFCEDGTQSV